MRFLCTLSCFLILFSASNAQELNCSVEVNTQKVANAERKIFNAFKESVTEFMNKRKWTTEKFKENEKIECSIFITIDQELGNDLYRATAAIQLSRPTFNSSYNSTVLNFVDKDWVFTYQEFQPLEYNDNVYISNLTSMLAFYAYMFIGMDYDCFALKGGTKYLTMAEEVLRAVPSNQGNAPGWKPFDSQQNRYWLITELMQSRYEPYRDAFYKYHMNGLDNMYEAPEEARKSVVEAIKDVHTVYKDKPTAFIVNLFISAKSDEVIDIFAQAPQSEKTEVINIMTKMDPRNAARYTKIIRN